MQAENEIRLRPASIARWLSLIATFLILLSIAGQISKYFLGHPTVKGFVPLFDVDAEKNIPTFFSVLLMISISGTLLVITRLKIIKHSPHRFEWALLAIGFLYLAFDEAFAIHERLDRPGRRLLNDTEIGVFFFSWVIFGILIVCLLAIVFSRFLIHLPSPARSRFLISGGLFVGGAIGCELVGGAYMEKHSWSFGYSMIATLEESLEMAGLIVFIWTLLEYCGETFSELRIVIGKD